MVMMMMKIQPERESFLWGRPCPGWLSVSSPEDDNDTDDDDDDDVDDDGNDDDKAARKGEFFMGQALPWLAGCSSPDDNDKDDDDDDDVDDDNDDVDDGDDDDEAATRKGEFLWARPCPGWLAAGWVEAATRRQSHQYT